MACNISNFSPDLYELEFDKGNADHRKLIRHLYRRIGYGASWADIEYAHQKTIGVLVNELIEGHLNDYERDDSTWNIIYDNAGNPTLVADDATRVFNEGKFDWVNEDLTIRRYKYCDDDKGNLILGDACNDGDPSTVEDDIQGDCGCEGVVIPVGGSIPERDKQKRITVNNLAPTSQNQLISNYWINESIIGGSNSVRAKLMLFWRGHFSTDEFTETSGDQYSVLRYFKVLFNNAFGNFRTFVEQIGRTPMMLVYLNGHKNAGHPADNTSSADENYARELLELFTMGEQYNGAINYGDGDVGELARALTGWRIRRYAGSYNNDPAPPQENEFRFQYGLHDWTSKTFLGATINGADYWKDVFGLSSSPPTTSIPNSTIYTNIGANGDVTGSPLTVNGTPPFNVGQDGYPEDPRAYITAGDLEYKAIHDVVFAKEDAIAHFICRKLYEFYVYGDVEKLRQKLPLDKVTELNQFIEDLADTFKGNNPDYSDYQKWDIIPVLKQLFKSRHFYDEGIIGAQIKNPVECGTSIFRAAHLHGGWGQDASGYDYRFKLPLLAEDYHTYTAEEDEDALNFYKKENNVALYNPMTGRGIVVNEFNPDGTLARDEYGHIINHATTKGYSTLRDNDTWQLMDHCGIMGQKILNPPNVAGWPGYHKWLNAFTWIKRREMAAYFLNRRFINTGAAEKFRQLAMNLLELEHPTDYANYYNNPREVTRVMWAHFIPVEPTEAQIDSAVAKYQDGWPVENYGPITLYPQDLAQWDNWNEQIRANVTKGIGVQVLNMVQDFTEQPEFQLN